jgi:hypothetical protein
MSTSDDTSMPRPMSIWHELSMQLIYAPKSPVKCPTCGSQSLLAKWQCVNLKARDAKIELICSSCNDTQNFQMILPAKASLFYPRERLPEFIETVQKEISPLVARIREHAKKIPALAFTIHPLWAEAKWSATAFRWHPTSEQPPFIGLMFDNAEAGKEIFREAERHMNHTDRFEEIRISIIEGAVPGQEQRPGYSVHISPDADALSMHATAEDFIVNPKLVPLLGQWNRHYPIPGQPLLLQEFKREFVRHKEFVLAPVVRKSDGQFWFEAELGIIKNEIHFRSLSDITPDDPDAAALLLPQFIIPPI